MSKARRPRSPAPRARWASTSSTEQSFPRAEHLAARSGIPRGTCRSAAAAPEGTAMANNSKAYVDALKRYDRNELHEPAEAMALVKSLSSRKFDETVEVAFNLGVDPRKAEQMLRGTVALPAGTGKTARIIVFAVGDAARDAEAAGADVVGADDLVKRIQNENFLDFDVAIA